MRNKNIFTKEQDNSGIMSDKVNDILNKLSTASDNFDIVKNNSGKLEIRQNNLKQNDPITLTFSDI